MSPEDATAADERFETRRVLRLMGLLLLLAAALGAVVLFLETERSTELLVPWWGLAVFFATTEAAVFHVQVKREAQTVSISELPLVIGFFFAEPEMLLLGRLVGSLVVFVVLRRSSLLKTAFNTVLVLTETLVALAVFHAFAGGGVISGIDPREWVAALGGALVANAVSTVAIGLVIAVYEGDLSWSGLLREMIAGQLFAPGVVVLGLTTVDSLAHDPGSGWLVAGSAATLILCYRLYASLFDRHVNLAKLYHFSQAITSSSANESVEKQVLTEAMDLLQSGHASIHLAGSRDSRAPLRIWLDADGQAQRELTEQDGGDWLYDRVVVDGEATLLPRRSRDKLVKQWLAKQGLRDALAVPLQGSDEPLGVLVVGDRLGEVRTYDRNDVLLLETLANHASVALQKGELIERLQYDALHDVLTGLPNRAQLQRELSHALQRSLRSSVPLAVMILDLDGFKDVNDTLGHQQGDLVLVEVSDRLKRAVGEEGLVARLGGDEFAVLVPQLAGREHAAAISRRLVSSLETPMELQGMTFEVGGSVGVAMCPEHGVEGPLLMKRADLAMYEAKAAGNKARFFQSASSTPSAPRLAMAAELRSALSNGELQVYLQPQLDLVTGEVRGMEALARWGHPTRGFISPDEFIPIAERSGLIKPLTMVVLDRALQAVSDNRSQGFGVSVNLSPRSLTDSDLVGSVKTLLSKWSIPPAGLTLEVTEGAVMTDPDRAIALLEQLRGAGVRLSVDDFGTGYSSLSYLTQLPVDEVKIDKSFIADLTSSRDDLAIVRSIIGLATTLGLDVVAEGVEDKATQDLLHALACTRVQGWHVSRPMPIDDIGSWLEHRRRGRSSTDAEVMAPHPHVPAAPSA